MMTLSAQYEGIGLCLKPSSAFTLVPACIHASLTTQIGGDGTGTGRQRLSSATPSRHPCRPRFIQSVRRELLIFREFACRLSILTLRCEGPDQLASHAAARGSIQWPGQGRRVSASPPGAARPASVRRAGHAYCHDRTNGACHIVPILSVSCPVSR